MTRLHDDADALNAALDADQRVLMVHDSTSAEHLDAVAHLDEALAHWAGPIMRGLRGADAVMAAALAARCRVHRHAHVHRLHQLREGNPNRKLYP